MQISCSGSGNLNWASSHSDVPVTQDIDPPLSLNLFQRNDFSNNRQDLVVQRFRQEDTGLYTCTSDLNVNDIVISSSIFITSGE